jgi:hypothetical protein
MNGWPSKSPKKSRTKRRAWSKGDVTALKRTFQEEDAGGIDCPDVEAFGRCYQAKSSLLGPSHWASAINGMD